MIKPSFCLYFLLFVFTAQAQVAQGYFVSQAKTASTGEEILVSIKKYNPTEEEIKSVKNYKKGPMNFLQLPLNATGLSLFEKSLESVLYCTDSTGKIKWNLSIGFSNYSDPSPLFVSPDFIYTGAGEQKQSKVTIQKISRSGNIVWKTELDSLENVNDVYVQNGSVVALVSFDHSEKASNSDGSFSLRSFPVYFFVELDDMDGKLKRKEYQTAGTWLSQQDFGHPVLNSTYSYYLHNPDSVIFLTTMNQKNMTVTSANMSKAHKVLTVAVTEESNHYLTAVSKDSIKTYTVVSDFYGQNKNHYEAPLYKKANPEDRNFISLMPDASVLAAIASGTAVQLYLINNGGQAGRIKTVSYDANTVVAGMGLIGTRPYFVMVSAAPAPGSIRSFAIKF